MHFLHDNRGVTALEYAVIAALVAMIVLASLTGVGEMLAGNLWHVVFHLGGNPPPPPPPMPVR